MKTRKSLMIISILLWGLFFISGCGDGVTEGTLNTTGASVALTPDAAGLKGLSAGQSCILTALLTDKSATPINLSQQQISFTIPFNSSGATITPLNGGITDSNGKAYAVYTAGHLQPGVIVQDIVQANIKDFSGVVIITRINGSGAGYTVTLTLNPATFTASTVGYYSTISSVLTAKVTDSSSTAVKGMTVAFSDVSGGGGTFPSATAVTDAGGNAAVSYAIDVSNPGKTFIVTDVVLKAELPDGTETMIVLPIVN